MLSRLWTIDTLWLLLLGALLASHVSFPFSGPPLLNDTYSVEISGRRAVYELAEKRFDHVSRNHDSLKFVSANVDADEDALCLIGPGRYPTPQEWDQLLDWVSGGGRLLIAAPLSDEKGFEIPRVGIKVEIDQLSDEEKVQTFVRGGNAREKKDVTARFLTRGQSLKWLSNGKVTGSATTLVNSPDGPQAIRAEYGQGWIVTCASDYVFTNGALNEGSGVSSYVAWRLLKSVGGDRGIVFDESLNAASKPTIEGLLVSDTLRPVTLQLSVLLVVFAWMGTRRFGGLLPRAVKARHDIVSHTDALGNLYFKRNDAFGTLKRYFEQWRTELRVGTSRKEAPQVERLARRIGVSPAHVKRLVSDTEAALSAPHLTRREAARLIHRLAEFREQVRGT